MKHRQKHLSAHLVALAALLSTASIQGAWAATALFRWLQPASHQRAADLIVPHSDD